MSRAGLGLQKLAKWRTVFASWQLGTRKETDPECRAVKDHREVTILLRAEVSALTGLLIERSVFTAEQFTNALEREADQLSADLARRFPGMEATEFGIKMDIEQIRKHGTMDGWLP